jgi:HK97 family phage portal protein
MSLIKRAVNSGREVRYTTYGQSDPYAIPSNGSLANYSSTGLPVDTNTAMGLAAVWTCVRILSTTIGSLAIDGFNKSGRQIHMMDENPSLVENPFGNEYGDPISRQVGIEQIMVSLLLRGNSFNYVAARDGLGFPTQLVPLNPDVVKVDRNNETGETTFAVGGRKIDRRDLLHIPGMSLPGQNVGMSPIAYLRQTIGLGLAADEYGARFYSNGANMSGIIEVASDLDPDAARQLKERFSSRNTGIRNAHNIGVLTGGAKFTSMGMKQSDMQFIQTREFNAAQIGAIFGVPPHLMGNVGDVSTSWGASPEQQGLSFLTYTLRPWLTRIEEALTNALPKGQTVRFNTDDILRTDAKGRSAIYASARTAGWITVNEIRAKENLPPVDGGDVLDTPLNSAHNGKNDGTDIAEPQGANA